MNNKTLQRLLMLVVTCMMCVTQAKALDTYYYAGSTLTYSLSEYNATCTGYFGTLADSLVIPSKVVINNKQYNVVRIGGSAFSGTSITSVTIPSTVTWVEIAAFRSCTNLKTLILEDSDEAITLNAGDSDSSKGAFDYSPLTYFYMGRDINGDHTPFSGGSSSDNNWAATKTLKTAVIGPKVTKIREYLFESAQVLSTVDFSNATSLTTICSKAFMNSKVPSVVLPASLQTIESNAFLTCGIQSVTFQPNGQLVSVGDQAFRGCTQLNTLSIPGTCTSLGVRAFANCTSLANLTLEDGTASLDPYYNDASSSGDEGSNNGAFCECPITTLYIGRNITGGYAPFGGGHNRPKTYLKTVTIGPGMTTMRSDLFSGCTNLTSVTFAPISKLQEIGSTAFYNCGFTSIELPASLLTIGTSAFNSCSKLTTLTFAEGSKLHNICDEAFRACSSLKEFSLPGTCVDLGVRSFAGCTALTTLTLQDGTEPLDPYYNDASSSGDEGNKNGAFCECPITTLYIGRDIAGGYAPFADGYNRPKSNLRTVTIGPSLTTLRNYLFAYCSYLNSVTVLSGSQMQTIGTYAFLDCPMLRQIDLTPATNLQTIGANAFESAGLTSMVVPKSVSTIEDHAFLTCSALASFTFEEGSQLQSIGTEAFRQDRLLSTLSLPGSLTTVGNRAFAGCISLNNLTLEDGDESLEIGYNDANSSGAEGSENGAFCEASLVTLYLGRDLTSRGPLHGGSAYSLKTLANVTVGPKVTYLREAMFESVLPMASIDLSNATSLKTICEDAFAGSGLHSIELPQNVTTIETGAFKENPYLATATLNDSLTTLGTNAFLDCPVLERVTFGENSKLNSMGDQAFRACSSLAEISIPATLNSLGVRAFAGCSSLHKLTIEDSSNDLDPYYNDANSSGAEGDNNGAFTECPIDTLYLGRNFSGDYPPFTGGHERPRANLTTVTIGPLVKTLRSRLFKDCVKLEDITLPETLNEIEHSCFWNTGLKNVTLPSSITSLGESIFRDCAQLETCTFADGYSYNILPGYMFRNSSLQSITIPVVIDSIRTDVFRQCFSLKDVVIEDSSKPLVIRSLANAYGTKTTTLGNQDEMGPMVDCPVEYLYQGRDINIDWRVAGDLHYSHSGLFFTFFPEVSKATESLKKVVIGPEVTVIMTALAMNCENLEVLDLTKAQKLKYIQRLSFTWCKKLTEVAFPATVVEIDQSAFYKCDLRRVEFPSNSQLKYLDQGVFGMNGKLEYVSLPGTLTEIGWDCFSECVSLKDLIFQDGTGTLSIYPNCGAVNTNYIPYDEVDGESENTHHFYDYPGGAFNQTPVTRLYVGRNLYCNGHRLFAKDNLPSSALSAIPETMTLQRVIFGPKVTEAQRMIEDYLAVDTVMFMGRDTIPTGIADAMHGKVSKLYTPAGYSNDYILQMDNEDSDYSYNVMEYFTIPSSGWNGVSLGYRAMLDDSVEGYIAEGVNGNSLTLQRIVDGGIKPGIPFIVHGEPGIYFALEDTHTFSSVYPGNILSSDANVATTHDEGTIYFPGIADDGSAALVLNEDSSLKVYKGDAYLTLANVPEASLRYNALYFEPHNGITGDVDGDGNVDVDDVNIVVNIMLGNTSLSDYPVADIDGNGVVDVDDVNAIINIMLGN